MKELHYQCFEPDSFFLNDFIFPSFQLADSSVLSIRNAPVFLYLIYSMLIFMIIYIQYSLHSTHLIIITFAHHIIIAVTITITITIIKMGHE